MTRRCDRCRAEYQSGADLGGHDYCMTGYSQLKQEEARKKMVVDNLEPAVLRGVESQGMVLAGSDESGIVIVSPERPLKLGSVVK